MSANNRTLFHVWYCYRLSSVVVCKTFIKDYKISQNFDKSLAAVGEKNNSCISLLMTFVAGETKICYFTHVVYV